MLFGMGTVVTFLTILVLITKAMSAVLTRLGLVGPDLQRTAPHPVATSANNNDQQNEELVSVITAAIQQFRSRHK